MNTMDKKIDLDTLSADELLELKMKIYLQAEALQVDAEILESEDLLAEHGLSSADFI
jgi:hypothetical protein